MTMSVTYSRDELLAAVQLGAVVSDRNPTNPILGNICINITPDKSVLSAASQLMRLDLFLGQLLVSEPIRFTVNAKIFFDILRSLPEGTDVVLEPSEHMVEIKGKKTRFSIKTLPFSDFPDNLTHQNMVKLFTITEAELKDVLNATSFAMGEQDIRPYLNGILLDGEQESGVINFVASDGHRLAWTTLDTKLDDNCYVIIPRRSIIELQKILRNSSDSIEVLSSGSQVFFKSHYFLLSTGVVDGRYPDYRRHVPEHTEINTTFNRTDMISCVGSISLLAAQQKFHPVRLVVTTDTIHLEAVSSEFGDAKAEIECTEVAQPVDVGFNSRYLLDVLTRIKGNSVSLGLSGSLTGAVIKDTEDPSTLYILMPLRV